MNTALLKNWETGQTDLIRDLKAKNQKAFSYLFDSYAGALLACIVKITGSKAAEDILQNTFVKIWNNIDSYARDRASLFTWMRSISHNEAIDYLRSRQGKLDSHTSVFSEADDTQAAKDSFEIARYDLTKSLANFPAQDRVIIELYNWGYTCREIGVLINLPEGTVKTKMRVIFKKLRVILSN